LPSAWADPAQRATILEFRQATRERDQVRAALRAEIPDPAAVVADRVAQAERLAVIRAERLATYDRPAEQPAPAVEAPAQLPEGAGLHRRNFGTIPKAPAPQEPKETAAQRAERQALEMIAAGPAGTAEKLYDKALSQFAALRLEKGQATLEALEQERKALTQARQAHEATKPWTPIGRGKWDAAGVALEQSGRDLSKRETAAAKAIEPKTIQAAAEAAAVKAIPRVVELATAERQAREAREAEQERKKNEALAAAKEKDAAGREFKVMAFNREKGAFGYGDKGSKWKAVPAELKEKIEAYNRLPEEKRERELASIGRDPETPKLLKKYREQSRNQGMER